MQICKFGYKELQKRFIVFVFGGFGEFFQQSFVDGNVVGNDSQTVFAFANKCEKIAPVEFLCIVQLKNIVDVFDDSGEVGLVFYLAAQIYGNGL